MGTRGPAPKAQRQRERDTKRRQDEMTVLVPDRRKRGPRLTAEDGFSPAVLAIYEDMRTWPQAQVWEQSEWLLIRTFLLPLYESFTRKPTASVGSEIRQALQMLGVSYPDRQRQRIAIATDKPELEDTPAPSTQVIDLMARLRG